MYFLIILMYRNVLRGVHYEILHQRHKSLFQVKQSETKMDPTVFHEISCCEFVSKVCSENCMITPNLVGETLKKLSTMFLVGSKFSDLQKKKKPTFKFIQKLTLNSTFFYVVLKLLHF